MLKLSKLSLLKSFNILSWWLAYFLIILLIAYVFLIIIEYLISNLN
jgi:hypothetical protein